MVDSIEYESSRTTPFGLNGEGLFDAEGNNFPDGRVVREYADLDLFFTRRPQTKDVNVLYNVTAVKRSIRNLVFLNFWDLQGFLILRI